MSNQLPWLTEKEVEKLTGKKRPEAQRRKLTEMQIDFRPGGGDVIVFRSVFDSTRGERGKTVAEPDMTAV